MFIESDEHEAPFDPSILLRPALREYLRRAVSLPPLVAGVAWQILASRDRAALLESFERLARALPTGIFDNQVIDAFLARLFEAPGRTNDFRRLDVQALPRRDRSRQRRARSSSARPATTTSRSRPPCRRVRRCRGCFRRSRSTAIISWTARSSGPCTPRSPSARREARRLHQSDRAVRQPPARAQRPRRRAGWPRAACPRCSRRPSARSSIRAWSSGCSGTARVPGRRRRAVRAEPARPRDVLHQHLQLCEPAPALRACVPEDPQGALRAAPRARADACAARHRAPPRRPSPSRTATSCAGRAPRPPLVAGTRAAARLADTLDDLERWLALAA